MADQTLQGMQKEMTQAINRAATATKKEERQAAAEQAKRIQKRIFSMLSAYQKAAKAASDTMQSDK